MTGAGYAAGMLGPNTMGNGAVTYNPANGPSAPVSKLN
jgi:hypothetical protein